MGGKNVMKKNMLTIVVIALCFMNLVLTALVVFTIIPTANKTNALISQVASIIDLELESPLPQQSVAMTDLEAVSIAGTLTINLKAVPGQSKDPFAVIDEVTVYLNKSGDDYGSFKTKDGAGGLLDYGTLIQEMINDTFSVYTKDEVQNNREAIKEEVLTKIQERFGTRTIADISFKNLRLQ